MRLYGEITKIEDQDDGSLKVFGVASTGARDEAGEIVLPAAMKAALPDYARHPALREMHQPSAAGRTLEADVDDDGVTRIVAQVVDPVAIAKVRSKTYSGFSIGGKVLARDPADRSVITRIRLSEISLVDRPCNPEAVIDLWKAAEGEAAAPFSPDNEAVKLRAAALARAAGRPTAWKDYVAKARGALIEENQASPEPEWRDDPMAADEPAEDLAQLPTDPIPADIPLTPNSGVASRLTWLLGDDPGALQAAHDALMVLGAQCHAHNCFVSAKSAITPPDPVVHDLLAKALPRLDALAERVEAQGRALEALSRQPLAPRTAASAHARAIGKADDARPLTGDADLSAAEAQTAFAALTPEERALLLMKVSLRQPIPVG